MPAIVCLFVVITILTAVPVMLVIVCARYSKQNFSFCVLFKVLTLPKGRKKCMHPLKHTSSYIHFCPLNMYTHINIHVYSGCRHGIRWDLKIVFERPFPTWRSCFWEQLWAGAALGRSIPQRMWSPAEDDGALCTCWNDIFQRHLQISRPFI